MSIEATHRTISGKTAQCTLCTMLPIGLPKGPIFLEALLDP
jgi:hypothetical protein